MVYMIILDSMELQRKVLCIPNTYDDQSPQLHTPHDMFTTVNQQSHIMTRLVTTGTMSCMGTHLARLQEGILTTFSNHTSNI